MAAYAERLGLDGKALTEVRQVALLHDIGKIAVPDAILNKPGALTEDEWAIMRTHPISSQRILGDTPGLEHLAPMLRAEHERWDGAGYPDGLTGESIPLPSRITFVCDAYDAMTSDRTYRKALPREVTLQEVADGAGTQFCPACAQAPAGRAGLRLLNQDGRRMAPWVGRRACRRDRSHRPWVGARRARPAPCWRSRYSARC